MKKNIIVPIYVNDEFDGFYSVTINTEDWIQEPLHINGTDDDECDCGVTKEDLEMTCAHDLGDGCYSDIPCVLDCEHNTYERRVACNKQDDELAYDSYRFQEWYNFVDNVDKHIINYTLPQYGDYPYDLLTTTSNECIIHDMKRYLNRFDKGQRGYKEAMRDMLKIAQYAGVIYNRLQLDFEPGKSPFKPDYMKEQDSYACCCGD